MATVVLVIHLMIAAALVAVVLLQRTEGGALGIGGSGGGAGGGIFGGRGQANVLTKTTTILGAAFFLTSIALTILARNSGAPPSLIDQLGQPASTSAPASDTPSDTGGGGILDELQPSAPASPVVPQSE